MWAEAGTGRTVAIALVVATVIAAGCFGSSGSELVDERAPDLTVVDVEGQAHNLTDYRGQVLLVEFFATWCTYCSQQLSELKDLRDDFTEAEIAFIHIDSDDRESEEKVREYHTSRGVGWPMAAKGERVANDYDVDAIPTTVIIDGDGVVRYYHTGVVKADKLKESIEDLL